VLIYITETDLLGRDFRISIIGHALNNDNYKDLAYLTYQRNKNKVSASTTKRLAYPACGFGHTFPSQYELLSFFTCQGFILKVM